MTTTSGTPAADGAGGAASRRKDPLGTFGDFIPWVLYWILVGNVAFRTALVIALLASAAVLLLHRATDGQWRTLPVGSFVVFAVLTALAFVVSDDFLERWLQPLSNLGLTLVVVGGMLVGRPFTLDYARDSVDPDMARSKGFLWINQRLSAIWLAAFALMTVSSLVPPMVEGEATVRDGGRLLSILGYWIVPFVGMGVAALVTVVVVRGLDDSGVAADAHPTGPGLPAPDAPPEQAGARLVVEDGVPADEALPIRVEGVRPGDEITLTTTLADAMGRRFTSTARFRASGAIVDPAVDVPLDGPWRTADPTAPIWAATWAEDGEPDLFLPAWGPGPVLVEARTASIRLERSVHRVGMAAGVRAEEVRGDGLVGRAFLPVPGTEPGPGSGPVVPVVLVGGSEGGLDSLSTTAAALASRGVPALVVALFGAPGLPAELIEVPLEPIGAAAGLLAERTGVEGDAVALLGLSRGSEAVLAAAAHLDGLRPPLVIGLSPGSTVWEALSADGTGTGRSSWTVGGEGLPFASVDDVAITRELFHQAPRRGLHPHLPQVMHLRAAYEGGLATAPAEAALPVERIDGRLVLHAGTADALWPSDTMAHALVDRRSGGTEGDLVHLHDGAGHLLRWPQVPTSPDRLGGLVFGGTPSAQAAAHRSLAVSVLRELGGRRLPETPSSTSG